jgi:hypothetical protein
MYTDNEKQDKVLDTVKQDIEIAYFFGLANHLGLMNIEQRQRDFLDVWHIELVADRLSYTGFWKQQYELFRCDN